MTTFPWLTALTVLPVVGAILLLLVGRGNRTLVRTIAVIFAGASLTATLILWLHFDSGSGALQYQERHTWIPALNVDYHVGVDGLGLLMLLLTSTVVPIGIAASWEIKTRDSLYFALILLLQACMFGSFTALNFFHFFLYWELSLIPAFFLIKLWGSARAGQAATQFLVYTMIGSVAMLLAFLAIYVSTAQFEFTDLATLAQNGQLMPAVTAKLAWQHFNPRQVPMILFGGAFLGFAVKVPLVPFHTWLPPAYTEAPSGTTAILTGAMSKMGVYGFLRILLPIFGAQMQQVLTPLLWLTVATIILSAYSALAQKDLKRIFAYSSINHLGFCLLAAFAVLKTTGADASLATEKYAAMNGVLLQMLNHALTAATLFWFVALLEKRTGGLRGLDDFGGLRKIAPVFTGLMGIAIFSSLGLPGFNGFPGEFLILKGTFPLATWASSVSILGLLATAIFLLSILQRVFSGPINEYWLAFPDLTTSERATLAGSMTLIFVLGLYPQLVVGMFNSTAMQLAQHLRF